MRRFLNTHPKERAQSLVEMALTLPILIFMFIGLFEIGYAIWGSLTLRNVDREATRFAVRKGALDYSGYTVSDIGYGNIITHALVSNAGQLNLRDYFTNGGGTPDNPLAAMIITHIIVDTQAPCTGSGCFAAGCPTDDPLDDLVRYPDMTGFEYLRYTYPNTSPITSRLDTAALAAQLKADNDSFNCRLGQKGAIGTWSDNSVVVVEMFYEQPQLLGFPLFAWMFNPVPLYAQTTMRIDSQDEGRCELYPIALNINTLNGWLTGEERDIWNGGSSSDRGWLSWQPNPSANYIEDELTNPRLAANDFTDPTDSTDNMLNAGDWISSDGGNKDSSAVRVLLEGLKNRTIMVPVWDSFGTASPSRYHTTQFAKISITDYCLNSGSTCSYAGHPSLNGYITARLVEANVPEACPGNGF